MRAKRILGTIILIGYIFSQILSYLGYIEWNTVSANSSNRDSSTQLVAILVDENIYNIIEKDLKWYSTKYIQKKYPQSKALVIKINTKEYDAPKITKLLENLYFDGLKDQSSRLIGLVIIGDIPLPVVKYEDYIFPSIYPYVDFLDQKYLWDEDAGYFLKNRDDGQAEIRHGIIPQGILNIAATNKESFFEKLKKYNNFPDEFVEKKIWYDDFIALKNNFLTENFVAYQNKLLFAEDLGYHRYTNFLTTILDNEQQEDNQEVLNELSTALEGFNINDGNLQSSLQNLQGQKDLHTPTKLLEQKLKAFIKDYYELLSIPLTHTISENIKASDRREMGEGHHQKIQIKDLLLLGDTKTEGFIKSINDKLEDYVDKKVEKERYAMKTTIPTHYYIGQNEKKYFLGIPFYIPKIHDTFQFFYFGNNAQNINKAEDFSIFRGSYRNLTGFTQYSEIIKDPINPAKTDKEKTDLYNKGLGSSYDLFSTQTESNRGFNIFNIEDEYNLYEKEKKHAEIKTHCVRRRFGLKWSWVPCAKVKWAPIGKCIPGSKKQEDHADCETFEQFGQRVWGGATPLNIDTEEIQNQIYNFKGNYTPESAWKRIFDIAGSISVKKPEYEGSHFLGGKNYSSPTKISRIEGELKDAINHSLPLDKVWYFNVDLSNKQFIKQGNNSFKLFKPKANKLDAQELIKYKIVDSRIEHKAPTSGQINGYSGFKEQEESEGYYIILTESFGDLKNQPSSGFLNQLKYLNQKIGELKTNFEYTSNSSNPSQIYSLISPNILSDFQNLSLHIGEGRANFNTALEQEYSTNIAATIQGILLRQIEQNKIIKLLSHHYNDLSEKFLELTKLLTIQEQIGMIAFSEFKTLAKNLSSLQAITKYEIDSHDGTGHNELIVSARTKIKDELSQLDIAIQTINQESPCEGNHKILGYLLGKKEEIQFINQNFACSTTSEEERMTIKEQILELKNLKDDFNSKFIASSGDKEKISGFNLLTPERPIDSPRYLSFQGVGENIIQLIYPNLFKVEVYSGSTLKDPKTLKDTKGENDMKKALTGYLRYKVEEYNKLLQEEKGKAKEMDLHYKKLFTIDKLATPTLESEIRPYKPFTYDEMLDAIGGEKMINTISELLYYQNITNQIKNAKDEIEKDLKETRKNLDINEKISHIIANYLTEDQDQYFDNKKNAYHQFIIPNYNKNKYEVGYINSDGNDYIRTDQDSLDINLEEISKKSISKHGDDIISSSEESVSIKKECGFDINEALLLINLETGKSDWREGLQCWLEEVKKKPFELNVSFEGSLGSVPIKDTIKNDIIAPLQNSRDNYQQEVKTSIAFHELDGNEINDPLIQEIFKQTQITINNKKINTLNKTGNINIFSLKDFGNLNFQFSSTGDNCLIIDNQNSCKNKVKITKNPFKNGVEIPFKLAGNSAGDIAMTLEICTSGNKCGKKNYQLSAVPGPIVKFGFGLPNEKKLLAGAYTLIPLSAFDQYSNKIQRSIDQYTISVDKGNLIIGGVSRDTQEVNDFQNLKLLYRAEENTAGTVKFSVKDKTGKLLATTTAQLLSGNIILEQQGKEINQQNYTIADEHYYLIDQIGNTQINTKRLIPITINLKDNKKSIIPMTTNLIMGTEKGLAKILFPKEYIDENKKKSIKMQEINSLFIENGSTTIYLDPGYIAGEEIINFNIPGLPTKKIKLNIQPGPLAKIKINQQEDVIEKNSSSNIMIILNDARGNKLKETIPITIRKIGTISLVPGGDEEIFTINIKNGEQKLKIKTGEKGGVSQIIVTAQSILGTIQSSQNIITKEFFLESAIALGLNIMYLNLFGSDRGNQREYSGATHQKLSDKIFKNSNTILSLTTQLVDLKKIKKTSLLLGNKAKLGNHANFPITAQVSSTKVQLSLGEVGEIFIDEGIKDIYAFGENSESSLKKQLKIEQETTDEDKKNKLFIYNLNPNFIFKNGRFFTQDEVEFGRIGGEVLLERTPQIEEGFNVWELKSKGQVLGSAILTQIDFSNSKAEIKNQNFEFGSTFIQGSTDKIAKALFENSNNLNDNYRGYDSIQNSHEIEKYIGFRGEFKNITYFAGGKSVGEATIPFGSEFLINIGDPLLKRRDTNENTTSADHNQGLGKIIYSDPEKPIFKTLDIDYNNDGLRDLLIIYQDGTIKLQKQYQDKSFQDMGTLMISAEQIKEVFIGDVDGNGFEDIIIRNTKDQLKSYTNEDGIFDVDGNIICLNTNVSSGNISNKPESLSGTYQIFLEDMDKDGKIDIVTFDQKGDLKIFYGNGNKNKHSYLSKDVYSCDDNRYQRQENSIKIVKTFGLQLDPKKAIRDESLIRWDGLTYPTEQEIVTSMNTKNNREKGIETDPILLKKMEDPALQASCSVLDYECKRNEYGEQFCKKYWRYNTCLLGCSAPAWPLPGERVCKQEYREMDRQNDDQRIRGKFSYEDGMCWVAPVATCVPSGYEEEGRIDSQSKDEIVHAGGSFDFIDTAQEGVGTFDKYVRNPFEDIEIFENQEDWAFIPIKRLETPSLKPLGDKIRDVSKRYTDLNGGKLENGDLVQVEVLIVNKYATFGTGSAFFDYIHGPWFIEQDKATLAPKNLKFQEGNAKINPKTGKYAYYLTNLQFSAKNEIVYTYTITYNMKDPLFKIDIKDIEITDYGKSTADGMSLDGLPDFIIQTANDGCNKKQAILFNTNAKAKKEYRESTIDLQELSDNFATTLTQKKQDATSATENQVKETKSTSTIDNMPGIDAIDESYNSKGTLSNLLEGVINDGELNIDFFADELKEVEKTVQDIADKMCNGFSFGLSNAESCEGLPVPFNQAFLAPGNYHLMGCIPMEPLTKTLGNGLPVFHFPGTLRTEVGPIPIPWGLKGPGDEFLRANGGIYPSQIRIYAAPTLTAQLGLAICFGSQSAGLKLPSPFSDIGGNCVVTSIPLPCGKDKENKNNKEQSGETYHAWAEDYRKTSTCQLKKSDSPFQIVASQTHSDSYSTSIQEGEFLGGIININYDSITSIADEGESGIEINGVKIDGVKDINNKIIGATQQGLMKMLLGWFDKQTQYWINNLFRVRIEFTFPDIDHLSQQISSFNPKEIGNLTSEGLGNTKEKIDILKTKSLKSLTKNAWNTLQSKEQITKLDLSNGNNPFEKLQEFFNDKELINIRSQDLNIKIPRIYSEDIEAYINYLKTWLKTNTEVLDARIKTVSAAYLSCKTELTEIRATKGASLLEKEKECKVLQDSKNQLMQMQVKFDKTSEQIFQNIQTLELYKRFPLEIYEWLHVSDKYLGEVSALLSNFFGYINYWMEVNAARFSQYTDAIITVISVIKTYQIMVDLFVNWGNKCGKCTQDSYDQYTCKLSFLCPELPIIPIPSVKIPSLYIDLSHLNLGMDIVLPKFNFIPESIELPRLPNLPEPPQLGLNIKIDFNIPDIPQLPDPPNLPELPSFIPQVKMQLPILPPAPKIPELPNQLTKMLTIAKSASKIFCIIKSGIGLVGESSVKARIEQMTQRTYNVPRVDNLDLTHLFKQAPLQGIDIQADSYVNLQYNFDGFYTLLKGIVDGVNQTTYHLASSAQGLSDEITNTSEQINTALDPISNPIQVDINPLGYQSVKADLKDQIFQFQNTTLNEQEKAKFSPVLSLLTTNNQISKNDRGLNNIKNSIDDLIHKEKDKIQQLAELAKKDYTKFLQLSKNNTDKENIQLTFSTSLLNKNSEIEKKISQFNPMKILVETEESRIDGYLNALTTHTSESLNMNSQSYENAKRYLASIKEKIGEWKGMQRTSYAGTQLLTNKDGASEQRVLLTQTSFKKAETTQSATTDLSKYIHGVLVEGRNRNKVNVVHSQFNYEQFPHYYEKDLNNDKIADLIMRDKHNVYVKYANDAETRKNQSFSDYYLITPILKNTSKKYETLNTSFFRKSQEVKLYDENDEIKNFNLGGQTFDSLNFSWKNNKNNTIDGYLMRISERIDGFLEKNDLNNAKYVLFLPNGTESKGSSITLNNTKQSIEKLLETGKIYEILYYNPSKDELQFNLHEVPRKWQYLQITSLKFENKNYSQNAPRSNQIVGGRQIIADDQPPQPQVELIRSKTSVLVDEGFDLEGFIGTYYDIKISRSDNVQVNTASIYTKEGNLIKQSDINAQEGTIIIKENPFKKETEKSYIITANDSEGNETTEEITLIVKIPQISIENIEKYEGRKEGIENPIIISSELETDIDEGDVSFERERKGTISQLSATNQGKQQEIYPVSTNITKVQGAYYDFGELIGLYAKNENPAQQQDKLYATINGKNGEILIQPAYKNNLTLGVDFSKGYPVVKVLQNQTTLFEILLKSEQLIKKEILKGILYPLEGSHYGNFDGGEVLMIGKEPVLYIAKDGTLRSDKPLQGKYYFDTQGKFVRYEIFENAFGEAIASITFKTTEL